MPEAPGRLRPARSGKSKILRHCFGTFSVVVVVCLIGIALGPISGSIKHAQQMSAVETSKMIALSLYQYSADHNGRYPTGKSSTEVFQKLMDENYITDGSQFYQPRCPGKTRAFPSRDSKLKSESVCYDITRPLDANSPGELPLVFLTGYKITYLPGASAKPISWAMVERFPCMAVVYLNRTIAFFQSGFWSNSGVYSAFSNPLSPSDLKSDAQKGKCLSDGTVTEFIASTLTPDGKEYRQLTPDGSAP